MQKKDQDRVAWWGIVWASFPQRIKGEEEEEQEEQEEEKQEEEVNESVLSGW